MKFHPVQASAADVSSEAAKRVQGFYKDLEALGVKIGLTVHDYVEYTLPPGVTMTQVDAIHARWFPEETP